jgi:hypothetical protein
MRTLRLSVALLLLLGACSDDGATTTETTTFTVQFEDQGPFEVSRPVGCETTPGSPIDLDAEPAFWLAFSDFLRWFDEEGCAVRIDVISHQHLAEHCGWEEAEAMSVGVEFGEPFSNSEHSRRYVWNRDGVVPDVKAGEVIPVDALPHSAEDTGYRQGDWELWIDPLDPTVLFVVGDSVRVFALEPLGGLCS